MAASSQASTTEASELERINRIMNDPIENLICSAKSYSEMKIGKARKGGKNRNITTAPLLKQR
jgi:hypothetical protein